MTPDDLEQLLGEQSLTDTLDVKSLTIDMLKKQELEELMDSFWKLLPLMTEEQLKGYFFMKRG